MPTVTWFEIPAADTGRAKEFYQSLFGWNVRPFPVEFKEDFWMVETDDGVGGDLFRREFRGQQMMIYIDVPSIEACLRRVVDLGGRVLTGKTEVPGMGYLAVCEDTEQNRFGLWERVEGSDE
ncbi:VOC family protein [Methanofollis aquaemaris]|uniref:VOC family protein n=1 Tax=Methanofollis aquaemaris TaxID=126734 RepID=A0A8A3S625_9EURY|nr:VOC family protein [Methanofollis aquaemaris]QSZ67171.1 VOC family protein [Methanofollis aquaemaris]